MASTCKYCGRDTWGRYTLCPQCRKERKGRGGSSYYQRRPARRGDSAFAAFMIIGMIVLVLVVFFWKIMITFIGLLIISVGICALSYYYLGFKKAILIFISMFIIIYLICLIFSSTNQNFVGQVEKNQFKDYCSNLTKDYANIKETIYFNNKTQAIGHYLEQNVPNNTQSYIISMCRLDQLNESEEAMVSYRTQWSYSPIICTKKGLLKCPTTEALQDN